MPLITIYIVFSHDSLKTALPNLQEKDALFVVVWTASCRVL